MGGTAVGGHTHQPAFRHHPVPAAPWPSLLSPPLHPQATACTCVPPSQGFRPLSPSWRACTSSKGTAASGRRRAGTTGEAGSARWAPARALELGPRLDRKQRVPRAQGLSPHLPLTPASACRCRAACRPTELEVGHEVSVEANELFWSDDFATHPLDAGKASAQAAWPAAAGRGQRVWRAAACRGVPPRLRRARRPRPRQQVNAARAAVWRPAAAVCGKCEVRTPAQADRRPGSSASRPAGPDTFVCSRKYIQGGPACEPGPHQCLAGLPPRPCLSPRQLVLTDMSTPPLLWSSPLVLTSPQLQSLWGLAWLAPHTRSPPCTPAPPQRRAASCRLMAAPRRST